MDCDQIISAYKKLHDLKALIVQMTEEIQDKPKGPIKKVKSASK